MSPLFSSQRIETDVLEDTPLVMLKQHQNVCSSQKLAP
jgi:hypothetical protein